MSIEWVAGDLFANEHRAQAFAHGCNCQGSMGAGIATGFRDRYPAMFEQYRAKCKVTPREFNLGDAWLWKAAEAPWVFNLGTQEGVWHARASYDAIRDALARMRVLADAEKIERIAIPRIGVGYGGLSWKKVRQIIETVYSDWTGTLIVYEKFVAAETAPETDTPAVQASRVTTGKPRKRSRAPKFHVRAVTIACSDLQRSGEFYEKVLGATSLATDNGLGRWYRLGKWEFTLLPNASKRSPASFPDDAMFMLWLEVDDLGRAIEHFTAAQVTIVDPGDGQFITIADPDGLLIEVWERE